jgi:DNA primase (bacterial type)
VIQADEAAALDVRPPMPAEFDPSSWPLPARVWLYKAGLSNQRIIQLGFYWNPRMSRVVMPVLDGQRLLYWQARGFDKDRPKYINPPIDKPLYKQGSGPVLVLTEDMLSAARVAEVTAAWSILGTSLLDDDKINDIIGTGLPVRVWLDPDGAGLKGRRKIVPKLRSYGVDAVSIKTAKDPKLYSKEEIIKWLT